MLIPLLHRLDAERAHQLAIEGLKLGLVAQARIKAPSSLRTRIAGLDLAHPVGLAAGFDKNAIALPGLAKLGFSHLEVGTVTPRPQTGNPKPRLFRLPQSKAVINRMGFNNDGLDAMANQLAARSPNWGVVGANIGANRDASDPIQDYVDGLKRLYAMADYFTINVSSPNTPGLRALQGKERLRTLLDALMETRRDLVSRGHIDKRTCKPLLLKIAPDLNPADEDDIIEVALALKIDALIIGNTTLSRPNDLTDRARSELGGLSGRPLFERSTTQLRRFYKRSEGRIPLIGVGGIEDGASAIAKIKAGASALQVYTGFIYQGPKIVGKILTSLARQLTDLGVDRLQEIVGIEA